jgi:tetratricopeptide (TPR) repeat protein
MKYSNTVKSGMMVFAAGMMLMQLPARTVGADAAVVVDSTTLAAADAAYQERRIESRAREALSLYRSIYVQIPHDPEVAWRLSMACYFVGFNYTTERSQKIALFAEGRDAGLAAVSISSASAPAHFWTAINMALYGDEVGVFKMLFSLKTIEQHLHQSVAGDPSYAYGGAYRVLATIQQSLPRVLGGNRDRAKEYLGKALALTPKEPINYLFMARLMEDKFDDRQKALMYARQGLQTRVLREDEYELIQSVKEINDFIVQYSSR